MCCINIPKDEEEPYEEPKDDVDGEHRFEHRVTCHSDKLTYGIYMTALCRNLYIPFCTFLKTKSTFIGEHNLTSCSNPLNDICFILVCVRFYVPEGDLMQLTDVARFLISSAVSLHCTPPPPPPMVNFI